jgi:hypothetical protein
MKFPVNFLSDVSQDCYKWNTVYRLIVRYYWLLILQLQLFLSVTWVNVFLL